MISHVSVCPLTHGEKSSISNTFCYTKREYSFSVRPIGCTPAFLLIFSFGLDRKGWITDAVGIARMCVNCWDCEAVGKLFADLWEKACLFPSGCE